MYIWLLLLWVFLLAFVTETLTELLVKSEVFKPIRTVVSSWGDWFSRLISCGYCTSVWIGFTVTLVAGASLPLTQVGVLNVGLTALIVHRLSNWLHNFNDCWLDKYFNVHRINSDKN